MKIIYVCNEYPPTTHGGIGVIVKDLAEGLTEKGHSVAVIGSDPLIKTGRQEYENGVWVTRLPMKEYWSWRIGRFTISPEPILSRKYLSAQLEKLIKIFKPDLVESFDWSGPLWKKPSVKLVVRMHGANTAHQVFENKRPSRVLSYFERRNLEFADSLCAVSQHIGELTLRALDQRGKRFTCLYNFVDTDKFKPLKTITTDQSKLLYVGRIHPRKGLLEFFHILKELFKINTNIHFELAGPYNDSYKQELIKILPPHQRDKVHFLGKIPHGELPALINSARLFVMPSRAEAFGLTAIEAMACGTAVMVTDKASGPEIVEEGETGWLINVENHLESARKIDKLLQQRALLDRVATNGRNIVLKKFSKATVLDENISYYTNLLS
ncbi:MAG: hypothetical protein CMN32_12940 [Saprospirales bacterium]|nr:hypothetical protein [Saprospirales bacterium]